MALIYCPECGHEISSTAVACPQCGRPTNVAPPVASRVIVNDPVERDGVPPWAIAAMALAGVFVVFGLIFLLSNRDDETANLAVNVNAQRRATAGALLPAHVVGPQPAFRARLVGQRSPSAPFQATRTGGREPPAAGAAGRAATPR